mgnify:CR=1 FL=1
MELCCRHPNQSVLVSPQLLRPSTWIRRLSPFLENKGPFSERDVKYGEFHCGDLIKQRRPRQIKSLNPALCDGFCQERQTSAAEKSVGAKTKPRLFARGSGGRKSTFVGIVSGVGPLGLGARRVGRRAVLGGTVGGQGR